MLSNRCLFARLWPLVLFLGLGNSANAEPSTPIKVIVPFSAGGITDQAARILTAAMGPYLGRTIIIDNRPGGGSRIGIEVVAKAAPDGDTLLFTNTSYSILPVVEPRLGFDPTKALVPIAKTASYGLGIVVNNNLPVRTLGELVGYAKKNPGKLSYGSAGPGSGAHFAGEYFKSLTGTSIVHVPYRSTSVALNDVVSGVLDMTFDASAKPFVDSGRVRLLAVTDAQRDPRFPSVPTASESGLKDFVLTSWIGFLAPPGTPEKTVNRLSEAAAKALADPTVQQRLREFGFVPQPSSPEQFRRQIRDDVDLYRRIATDGKLRFE